MLICEPLKDEFDGWMLQLYTLHKADCTTRQPSSRCSCGLHYLMTKIRSERNDFLEALKAQEEAELAHANCSECIHTTRDWSCCESCSVPFGKAIELRRAALATAKYQEYGK